MKFTRRPASDGINGGVNEGINRLLEFIRKNPGQRVVEIAAALNIPSKSNRTLAKEIEGAGKDRLHRSPEDWRVSRELMIEAVIINWSEKPAFNEIA